MRNRLTALILLLALTSILSDAYGQASQPQYALEVLTGHKNPPKSLVFSPNGEKLLSVNDEGGIVWDSDNGSELRRISTEQGAAFAFCDEDTLLIWNKHRLVQSKIGTGDSSALPTIPRPISLACNISDLTYASVQRADHNSGWFLAVNSLADGSTIRKVTLAWNADQGLRFLAPGTVAGWSSKHAFVYTVSTDSLQTWDTDTPDGRFVSVSERATDPIAAVYSKQAAEIRIVSLVTKRVVMTVPTSAYLEACIDDDGEMLVELEKHTSETTTNIVHAFELSDGHSIGATKVNPFTTAVAVNSHTKSIAVGGTSFSNPLLPRDYGPIEIFSTEGDLVSSMQAGSRLLTETLALLNGTDLETYGDSTVNLWDGERGDIRFRNFDDQYQSAAVSHDSHYLVLGPKDGGITLVDLRKLTKNTFAAPHPDGSIAVSSDGHTAWTEDEGDSGETKYVIHLSNSDFSRSDRVGCTDQQTAPHFLFSSDSSKLATWCDDVSGFTEDNSAIFANPPVFRQLQVQVCITVMTQSLPTNCHLFPAGSTLLGYGLTGDTIIVAQTSPQQRVSPSLKALNANTFSEISSMVIDDIPSALIFDESDKRFAAVFDDRIDVYEARTNPQAVVRSIPGHFEDTGAAICNSYGVALLAEGSGNIQLVNLRTSTILGDIIPFESNRDWVFVAANGAFDGTAQAMKWVGWRDRSNLFYPLDFLFQDFYSPLGLRIALRGTLPSLSNRDIYMQLKVPGLRTMVPSGMARIVEHDKQPVLCVTEKPQQLAYFIGGVNTGWNATDFIKDDSSVTCRYRHPLPLSTHVEVVDETKTTPNTVVSTPWDGQKRAFPRGSHLRTLLIGVGQYPPHAHLDVLQSATDSVDVLEKRLKEEKASGRFGESITSPVVLTDSAATSRGIRAQFAKLEEESEPDDTVFIYIAGHGSVPAGQEMYYYLPYDAEGANMATLRESALSSADFADIFRRLRSRNLLKNVRRHAD
jgi:WD40 repeat protein